MFVASCRTLSSRNGSSYPFLNLSTSSTNLSRSSNITDGEWVVNSISLLIFVLAVLGNTAALIVMFGSRGPIRLTNNKYLVNLACADLLRACFMPFTIIARVKRNFVFGPLICKILPIVQGLSVAVDVFTLVCISVERYIAICRPLLILKLQSLRFGSFLNGLILFLIWTLGLLTALPNISMYHLCSLPQYGRFKCEKVNPEYFDERVYMIALDVFYFLIPMLVMLILYTLIICKIYKNSTATKMRFVPTACPSKTHSNGSSSPPMRQNSCQIKYQPSLEYCHLHTGEHHGIAEPIKLEIIGRIPSQQSSGKSKSGVSDDDYQITSSWPKNLNLKRKNHALNSYHSQMSKESKRSNHSYSSFNYHSNNNSHNHNNNHNRSRRLSPTQGAYHMDRHRRKALKLLIAIIVEFFICWTPLFIYHTVGTFDKKFYRTMPTIYVDLILLFSFASLLCNPFTYYFMSKRYRTVLYAYLSYCCCIKDRKKLHKKSDEARQIVEALRLHQQQNSLEYKQKLTKIRESSPDYMKYQEKLRSNTVQ